MKLKNRFFLALFAAAFVPFATVSLISLELAFRSIDMVTSPGIGNSFTLSDSLIDASLSEYAKMNLAELRRAKSEGSSITSSDMFDATYVLAIEDSLSYDMPGDSLALLSLSESMLKQIVGGSDSTGYVIDRHRSYVWSRVAVGDSVYVAASLVQDDLNHLIARTVDNSLLFDQFKLLKNVNKNYFRIIWAISIVAYLILILIISRFLARGLTRPLTQIGSMADRIGEGNWDVKLEYAKKDEIGTLVSGFNRMSDRLTDTTNRLILSEKKAAWESTARVISHGIKNVLAPVKLAVGRLSRAASESDDETRTSIDTIESELETLEKTANDFSFFGRSRQSEPSISNLNMLVRQSLRLCEDVTQKVSLDLVFLDSGPRANIDEAMVREAVINLIRNACEAAPNGSSLEIHTTTDENQVAIRICNDAPGFDVDVAGKMFEPYHTTKPSGTGLGLAIAQKAIESSGGSLTWNFDGKRVCFTITFDRTSDE